MVRWLCGHIGIVPLTECHENIRHNAYKLVGVRSFDLRVRYITVQLLGHIINESSCHTLPHSANGAELAVWGPRRPALYTSLSSDTSPPQLLFSHFSHSSSCLVSKSRACRPSICPTPECRHLNNTTIVRQRLQGVSRTGAHSVFLSLFYFLREMVNAYNIIVGEPEDRRPLGRSRSRRKEKLKHVLKKWGVKA